MSVLSRVSCIFREMRHRLLPWAALALLAAFCAAVITGVALVRRQSSSPAALLGRLPSQGAVIASIDFRALRRSGALDVLAGSKVTQEPEYRSFVYQTGFDYLNDLDSASVAFHSTGIYFVLSGRFQWKTLKEYTVNGGGTCHNTLCRIEGSAPDRMISYFPLRPDVMALAVSSDGYAATGMQGRKAPFQLDIPREPLWLLIPVAALRSNTSLPSGARAFVRVLERAETVLFAAGPDGKRWTVRLDATCRDARDAAALVTRLRDTTAQLRDLIAREGQTPNPSDLSGVLTAGAFEQRDLHVLGRWLIEREFFESLTRGTL
jgi:hypothetical protein